MPVVFLCHHCGSSLGHGVWRWECAACSQLLHDPLDDPPGDDDAGDDDPDTDLWVDTGGEG